MTNHLTHPIEVAQGIYWIGALDAKYQINTNPYMIVDGEEAIILDGGSRPDFSTVMLKILQVGVKPQQISELIYHHYDPDLCGSLPHFEGLINSETLKIISHRENNVFISHYGSKSPLLCINDLKGMHTMKSGRVLSFYHIPYAHSTGSFVTFDEQTGTLFSGDLFGSFRVTQKLYHEIPETCLRKDLLTEEDMGSCHLRGVVAFQRLVMPSNKALHMAIEAIRGLPIKRILPQHGQIIEGEKSVHAMMRWLGQLDGVGIDGDLSRITGK